MRTIRILFVVMLSFSTPIWANSIFTPKQLPVCVHCRSLVNSSSALLLREPKHVPDVSSAMLVPEPSTFTTLSLGLLLVFVLAPTKQSDEQQHASSAQFSEFEKHIIRFLFLGLSDRAIAHALHLPAITVSCRISELMLSAGANDRQDLLRKLSRAPNFQPWLKFLRSRPGSWLEVAKLS